MVLQLLAGCADVEVKDRGGWSALAAAAAYGREGTVMLLLDARADVEARDVTDGDAELSPTALHQAAEGGHAGTVRVLLDAGADLAAKDGQGWTSLHRATVNRNGLDVVKVLLDAGADVTRRDVDGDTPLHHAARRGTEGLARVLLHAGADGGAKNDLGATPENRARAFNHPEVQPQERFGPCFSLSMARCVRSSSLCTHTCLLVNHG